MTTRDQTDIPSVLKAFPTTWATATLGDIAIAIRSGKSSGKHSSQPPGILHLRPMNISRQGEIVLSDVRYVQEKHPNEFPRLAKGDIIFNNTNSPDLVGKTSLVESDVDWAYSNHMTALRLPSVLSPRFFALQIHYFWMMGFFRSLLTHHVNQASVSKRTLADDVVLAVPPIQEQHRIVQQLDALTHRLNASCASLQRAQHNSAALTKAIIRMAVFGGDLDFSSHADRRPDPDAKPPATQSPSRLSVQLNELDSQSASLPFSARAQETEGPERPDFPWPLPQGWSWTTVREIGEVRLGKQRSPKNHTGPYLRPYLRVANVFEDRIDTADVKEMNFPPDVFETYRLQHGDILLNEGQSLELVGRPAMFRGELQSLCYQNTLIRFRASDTVMPDFALLVFRYYFHTGHFQNIARWSTNIAHLGLHRFAPMPFPLPPRPEQEHIVSAVSHHLAVVSEQSRTISHLLQRAHELRRAMLVDAFSGDLVPQQLADGRAEDLLLRVRDELRSAPPRSSRRTNNHKTIAKGIPMRHDKPRSIYDVLVESGGALPTPVLFERCGFTVDTVDSFYDQLKTAIRQGRIRESGRTVSPDEKTLHPSQIELV